MRSSIPSARALSEVKGQARSSTLPTLLRIQIDKSSRRGPALNRRRISAELAGKRQNVGAHRPFHANAAQRSLLQASDFFLGPAGDLQPDG